MSGPRRNRAPARWSPSHRFSGSPVRSQAEPMKAVISAELSGILERNRKVRLHPWVTRTRDTPNRSPTNPFAWSRIGSLSVTTMMGIPLVWSQARTLSYQPTKRWQSALVQRPQWLKNLADGPSPQFVALPA